jgi:polyhydroxybutyrate depolymerase
MVLRISIICFLFFLQEPLFCRLPGSTITDSIKTSGVYRRFNLYIPSSYDSSKAVPLIIDLHGLGSNSQLQQLYSDFMPIADTAGFLIAYPLGSSGNPYWNAGLINGSPYDSKFISELIDSIDARYFIDNDKVFCSGFGNGGILNYFMSCTQPSKIAAISSVGGTMYGNWFPGCKPSRVMPVIEIHGTQDTIIPYNGTGLYVHVDSVIKKWVKHNGCNSTPSVTNIADTNFQDNSSVIKYSYIGGVDGCEVELYKVVGGSHSWPGSTPVVVSTNLDMEASVEIWNFFRRFKLSQFVTSVGLRESELNDKFQMFPNPVLDKLTLNSNEEITFEIIGLDGATLDQGISTGEINTVGLQPGCYILKCVRGSSVEIFRFIKL